MVAQVRKENIKLLFFFHAIIDPYLQTLIYPLSNEKVLSSFALFVSIAE